MIRVVHVISTLGLGGAETMLLRLVTRCDRRSFDPEVIVLGRAGSFAEEFVRRGVRLRVLGVPRALAPIAAARLGALLRRERPEVVQTWMHYADLVGGLAARASGVPVAWGVRMSHQAPSDDTLAFRAWLRACALLSRSVPSAIVCNSEAGRAVHVAAGYHAARIIVVDNGFELERYRPDAEARRAVRLALDLPLDAPVIGLVARFHPQKDFPTFVRAAALLGRGDARFVLCGPGVTWENAELVGWLRAAGIADRFRLLGERRDVPRVVSALDLASSTTSIGEGFSNTIGEAMACGVPCVATDVGDARRIIGDTGRLVPPSDAGALAAAWDSLLSLAPGERAALGAAARRRVEERFGIERSVAHHEAIYRRIAHRA